MSATGVINTAGDARKVDKAGYAKGNVLAANAAGILTPIAVGTDAQLLTAHGAAGTGVDWEARATVPPAFTRTVGPVGSGADYECTGSNDSAQINAAITYCNTLGSGTVYIFRGTYNISTRILPQSNVHLRGESMVTTRLAATSALNRGIIDNKTETDINNPTVRFLLSDLELDGTNFIRPSQCKGVNSSNWINCHMWNIWCHDTTATGLGADDFDLVTIDRCVVERCGTPGLTATVTLTSDNVLPSAGETVTLGSVVYTLRAALVGANDILIGASADATLANLVAAINGAAGSGTVYGTGTVAHPLVSATLGVTAHTVVVSARLTGTVGNGIASTETSAHLSFSAATTTGGTVVALGNNGIGIATGSASKESCIVTNCLVRGAGNNGFLYEEDNTGIQGPEATAIFANCISIDSLADGFRNSGTPNVSFLNCQAYNSGQYGFHHSIATLAHLPVNCVVEGCTAIGSRLYGIYMDQQSNRYLIRGNIVTDGQESGIATCSNNGEISGNIIYNNGKHGILLGPFGGVTVSHDNMVITDNLVYNNSQAFANFDGIILVSANNDINNFVITGNRCFDDQSVKTQRYGIAIPSGAHNLTGILIANNNCAGNKTGGILRDVTKTSGITIVNNDGYNPERWFDLGTVGGAVTLDRINGNVLSATLNGNATFAMPSTANNPGDQLTVRIAQDATGGWTGAWAANVALAAALTLPTAAGAVQVVSFVWDGSKWRETSRAPGATGLQGNPGIQGPPGPSGAAVLVTTPVVTSGRWYATTAGAPSTNGLTLNSPTLHPFFCAQSGTISDVAFEVTVASTSGTMRVGIYADNGSGSPGALITEWGTVATGTTGIKTITGLAEPIAAGTLYWICILPQTSTCSVRTTTGYNPYIGFVGGTPSLNSGANYGAYGYASNTGALGALGAISFTVFSPAFAVRWA